VDFDKTIHDDVVAPSAANPAPAPAPAATPPSPIAATPVALPTSTALPPVIKALFTDKVRDEALGDNRRHDHFGVVHAPPAMKAQGERSKL
jgi:hypothetical protein